MCTRRRGSDVRVTASKSEVAGCESQLKGFFFKEPLTSCYVRRSKDLLGINTEYLDFCRSLELRAVHFKNPISVRNNKDEIIIKNSLGKLFDWEIKGNGSVVS